MCLQTYRNSIQTTRRTGQAVHAHAPSCNVENCSLQFATNRQRTVLQLQLVTTTCKLQHVTSCKSASCNATLDPTPPGLPGLPAFGRLLPKVSSFEELHRETRSRSHCPTATATPTPVRPESDPLSKTSNDKLTNAYTARRKPPLASLERRKQES